MDPKNKIQSVEEYIDSFPDAVKKMLTGIRQTIQKVAPDAKERMSYGMPFYEYKGNGTYGRLIYFAAFKKHISLFITPQDTEMIAPEMKAFHVSKATYQFPLGKPFPFKILENTVKQLVDARNKFGANASTGKTETNAEFDQYHDALDAKDRAICEQLRATIDKALPKSERKIWHRHPVWFLEGNPIVGYSKQKAGIRLMFWSGASFEEEALNVVGKKFKDASIFYSDVSDIHLPELKRWLKKSISIQWDYKHIVKRKGKLERLK